MLHHPDLVPRLRRWEIVVSGIDTTLLTAASVNRLRVGVDGSAGVLVDVAPHPAGVALTATDPDDTTLDTLEGPVLLWWPDGLGRMEVTGELTRGSRSSTLTVAGSPRRTQHRAHRRVPLDAPMWITGLDTGHAETGRTRNISAGGVAATLDGPVDWCDVDDAVAVCVTLDGVPFVAAGTLRRIDRERFVSVRFDTLATVDESRISAAVLAAEQRRSR